MSEKKRKSASEVQKEMQIKMNRTEDLAPRSVTSGNPADDTQTQAVQEAKEVLQSEQMEQRATQAVEPVQQVNTSQQNK